MPVYDRDPDNIVGIVNTKDLFHLFSLRGMVVLDDAMYLPIFVDPERPISDVLRDFAAGAVRWPWCATRQARPGADHAGRHHRGNHRRDRRRARHPAARDPKPGFGDRAAVSASSALPHALSGKYRAVPRRDLFQPLAATVEMLVDLDGGFLHQAVRLLRTAAEDEILTARQAGHPVLAVEAQPQQRAPWAFVSPASALPFRFHEP